MKSRKGTLFLKSGLFALCFLVLAGCQNTASDSDADAVAAPTEESSELFFKISLAQWSFHQALGVRGDEPTMDNLDFAAKAKALGADGLEYVNQFFKDKAEDEEYLGKMKQAAEDAGVESLLIMVDGEGGLGNPNEEERAEAVANHHKWVTAAKFLGCHSIRVNAYGEGSEEEVAAAAVKSLGELATFAKEHDINIIVENHGGYSSDGNWMAAVIDAVDMDNCGMLPDFGNFCTKYNDAKDWKDRKCLQEFDRYEGVELFMKTAKAVSAKSHEFDEEGNETKTDYMRMMKIVKDAGYTGYVGIEYEGSELSEEEGIKATRALLEKVGKALNAAE